MHTTGVESRKESNGVSPQEHVLTEITLKKKSLEQWLLWLLMLSGVEDQVEHNALALTPSTPEKEASRFL